MNPLRNRNFKRTTDIAKIKIEFLNNLRYLLAKDEYSATKHDLYVAVAKAAWEPMTDNWINTQQTYYKKDAKRIYYLSLEFMMGRALGNALTNMQLEDEYEQAMDELSYSLEDLQRKHLSQNEHGAALSFH